LPSAINYFISLVPKYVGYETTGIFDEDRTIDTAIGCFRAYHYRATSIRYLDAALGIGADRLAVEEIDMTALGKALAFDTGGTVLDWHSGVSAALAAVGARRSIDGDWPAVTNEYRRRVLKGMTGQVRPSFNIDDVHRRVLDELVTEFGWSAFTEEDRSEIVRAWHALDAWPGFPAALARLRCRYVAVSFTILSTSLIVDVSRRNGLAWDGIVSCEMIGSYKPNLEAYATCARWLGYRPEEIVMVACHNFDLLAAHKVGFRTAFVHRPDEWGAAGPPDPTPAPSLDIVLDNFGQLADRLGA
jgi:2-haloacid dehalogenase